MRWSRLAANTGRKKVAKNHHLGTIAQLCRAISSQLRHVLTIGKKLVKLQYLLHMSLQYGELRPTIAAKIVSLVWGTPGSFNWFRALAALLHGTVVVGVNQTFISIRRRGWSKHTHNKYKMANDSFKCDSACVSWLEFSVYFKFCRFRALAYTTLHKL